jgi:hypothetical protein
MFRTPGFDRSAALDADPLAFRLRNLTDPRMRRVLQAAAATFGWQEAATGSKRGFGLACNIDAGTYVATMAEVKVDLASGRVEVIRVVCAHDMGIVVNPEGARCKWKGESRWASDTPCPRSFASTAVTSWIEISAPMRSRAFPGCPESTP